MVDMFFYRDPEEVEKQQQEEAQSKALAAGETQDEAAQEWDVTAAPQAGSINPAVLESGALDWSAEPAAAGGDWAAEPAGGAGGWGADATPAAAASSAWD